MLIISFIQDVAIVPTVQTLSQELSSSLEGSDCHISQQPAHEEWLLSLVTESLVVKKQGRVESSIYSPESDSVWSSRLDSEENSESSSEVEMVNKTLLQ